MFETQIRLYEFLRGYCHQIVKDVADDELANRPYEGGNPPGWILGHLAICTDYAARALGGSRACPREWHVAFAPKTTPSDDAASYPAKSELMTAYDEGHKRVVEALGSAPEELFDKPHGIELLQGSGIETVGDFIGHLMTSHESFHISQLSTWRRLKGLGPLV